MNRSRVKGFVLETQKYREYDELCWIFTEHGHLLTAIIRGSKKKNAKYNGQLEPFTSFYFDIQIRPGLSVIFGFERVHKFVEREESLLPLFLYGTQVNELLKKAVSQLTPSAALYNIVEKLYTFVAQDSHPMLAATFLEKNLAPYLGVSFTFTHCAGCGSTEHIKAFSFEQGGLVCKDCFNYADTDIHEVTVLKALIAFDRLQIYDYDKINIGKTESIAIQQFWSDVFENSLGIVLKSQQISMKGSIK